MGAKAVMIFSLFGARNFAGWRERSLGHHIGHDGAVLGAVNASVLRTDRETNATRLRALTAPPRSAIYVGFYVMAGLVNG